MVGWLVGWSVDRLTAVAAAIQPRPVHFSEGLCRRHRPPSRNSSSGGLLANLQPRCGLGTGGDESECMRKERGKGAKGWGGGEEEGRRGKEGGWEGEGRGRGERGKGRRGRSGSGLGLQPCGFAVLGFGFLTHCSARVAGNIIRSPGLDNTLQATEVFRDGSPTNEYSA